jgi:hypothetical protein
VRSTDIATQQTPSSPPCAQPPSQPHVPEDTSRDTLSESEPFEVSDGNNSVELIEDADNELGV